MKSKSSLKNSFVNENESQEKNDFLQKSNHSLDKSNVSNEKSARMKNSSDNIVENEDGQNNQKELDDSRERQNNEQEQKEQQELNADNSQWEGQHSRSRSHQEGDLVQEEQLKHEQEQNQQKIKQLPYQTKASLNAPTQHQLKSLLSQLKNQLQKQKQHQQTNQAAQFTTSQHQRKSSQLQQQIQVLQIKIRLHQKLQKRKQLISFQRINHLEYIFKHYCTHIFKTGKHMTFDRLEYEKVHLTIDRLCVLLKDFNLTNLKMKDGKIREIIEKQQIIKLFKRVSPNCRDLDFQQFIIIIEKLGELYFDCKMSYEQRKQNERKQRLKIKENLQKKEKYKQQMLKKHQQKLEKLSKEVIENTNDQLKDKQQTQGAQNDDLVEKMMNQNSQNLQQNTQSRVQSTTKKSNLSKTKKSSSLYSRNFKHQIDTQVQQNPLLTLSRQQKIQYFYEIINVDDIQSFSNKMRQLNLPLFKIYAGQQQNAKKESHSQKQQRQDQYIVAGQKGSKIQTDDEKRLKQLREKLNERNQKLKQSSVPSLTKEEYDLRKLKRSRMQQQESSHSNKKQRKNKKIDLTEGEINLSSLSKLAYDNVNFSKFNPKSFYQKQQDDDIFLKQYGDSPVRTRKPPAKTQLSKISQNTKRLIEQKDKNSQNFLQKLKKRQSEVQINQKKEEVSQMYRFNDRTQRQKRLIDKFLEKNK